MTPGWIAFVIVAASILVWAAAMARTVRVRGRMQAAEETAGAPRPSLRERLREAGEARRRAKRERRDEVTVSKVPEPEQKPLTPEWVAMSRRKFLNRAWGEGATVFLGIFGMGTLSFLWPRLSGGFGTKLSIGDYNDLIDKVGPKADFVPLFFADGRFWLTYYDGDGDDPVYLANGAKKYKLQALYRKCVHLGCSVPFCNKSYLYECPCHGSKYTLAGEYFGGPAPRGLDRFPVEVSGGKVTVDTSKILTGPPRGTSTWPQFAQPKGPFCVPT